MSISECYGLSARAIQGESAPRHDHVNVSMVRHRRTPSLLGSAAFVVAGSADAVNKRSQITALF
jgi:hypothetical protein